MLTQTICYVHCLLHQSLLAPRLLTGFRKRDFPTERDESRRLMRVNHTGEACAQALYQGQSMTVQSAELRETFREAAEEEEDHLAWCANSIEELNGKTSRLNPIFYAGSFAIGALAGLIGDKTSAAFLAETEHQVSDYLELHMNRLPANDKKSFAVLKQMREDELKHAKTAKAASSGGLPDPVRYAMRRMSKIMTGTNYWI